MRMKLRLILTLLAALALPLPASAQVAGTAPSVGLTNWTVHVSAASTASSQSTGCITLQGHKYLVVGIKVDRDGTPLVSAAATTCKAHTTASCNDTISYQLGSCSGSTCTEFNPSWAIDADEGWLHRFDVAGADFVKCTTAFTAGDAGDTVTIETRKTRE